MGAKETLWQRTVHKVGDKGVAAVKKHPVLTAGVVGGGVALKDIEAARKRTEEDLMANYTGKYAAQEALQNFRAQHEKQASDSSLGQSMTVGFGKGLGQEAASRGLGTVGLIRDKLSDQLVYQPRRDMILKQLVATDPIISRYEQENPGQTVRMYKTMVRFAPTLSTDPNAVSSFLRNAAMTGGVMDYKTIEGLAGAELMINKATNPDYR